jgi:hypothetical protein
MIRTIPHFFHPLIPSYFLYSIPKKNNVYLSNAAGCTRARNVVTRTYYENTEVEI